MRGPIAAAFTLAIGHTACHRAPTPHVVQLGPARPSSRTCLPRTLPRIPAAHQSALALGATSGGLVVATGTDAPRFASSHDGRVWVLDRQGTMLAEHPGGPLAPFLAVEGSTVRVFWSGFQGSDTDR